MGLKVAIQMDPIEGINPVGDTTFLMALNAQERGHQLWTYQPENLSLEDGRVTARGRKLEVRDLVSDHQTQGDHEIIDLGDIDVVLMRQDPPFDIAYITAPSIYGPAVYPLETSSDLTETNRRIWDICSSEPRERTDTSPYGMRNFTDVRVS